MSIRLPCWGRLGIDLEQTLGSTTEGFGQGPLALLGKAAEITEQLFGDLDLSFDHAEGCPAPSNPCQRCCFESINWFAFCWSGPEEPSLGGGALTPFTSSKQSRGLHRTVTNF